MNDIEKFHPSKQFKYCPFCGAKDFAWDGSKKFVCPVCKRQFYINMSSAVVALIFNEAGELLLTRRKRQPSKGFLDTPGGFVDLGETVEHAVVREIKEELDIEVFDLKFYGTFPNEYVFDGIMYFTDDSVFFCKAKNLSHASAHDDISAFVFKKVQDINVDEIGLHSIKNLITKLQSEGY